MKEQDNSTSILTKKILEKKKMIKSIPNPLAKIKREKEETKKALELANQDSKDPNKAVLIAIEDINPLLVNGEVMHNRSGMSSKDKQELNNFAKSLLTTKEGTLYNTGLMQAIVVRESKNQKGMFELIAGYRRTEAFKINKQSHIPAVVVDVDDKTARRLRNAENKQRRALNAYDETYGELEEIQLYLNFSTLKETEKVLRKAKRVIEAENALLKKTKNLSGDDQIQLIKDSSSFEYQEHLKAKELKEAVKEITQKALPTFINKLEILNIVELIKNNLLNNKINYSEALSLKKIIKDDDELIKKAVNHLEVDEAKNNKRMSIKQFETYLRELAGVNKANRGHKTNKLKEIKLNILTIKEEEYQSILESSKSQADKILAEISLKIEQFKKLL